MNSQIQNEKAKVSPWLKVWSLIDQSTRGRLFFVIFLVFLGSVAELISIGAVIPLLHVLINPDQGLNIVKNYSVLQPFINYLFNPKVILSVFIISIMVSMFLRMALVWVNSLIIHEIGHSFSKIIFDNSIRSSLKKRSSFNTSDVQAAVNKVQVLVHQVFFPILDSVTSLFMTLIILAGLSVLSIQTTMTVFSVLLLVYLILIGFIKKSLRSIRDDLNTTVEKKIKIVQESLGALRDILIFKCYGYFNERFASTDYRFRKAHIKLAMFSDCPKFMIEACMICGIMFVFYGVSQNDGGAMSAIPVFAALVLAVQRLLPLLQRMYRGWSVVSAQREVVWAILEWMSVDKDEKVLDITAKDQRILFEKNISLANVCFSYRSDAGAEYILENLNLDIKKGERIAFIGSSGSGKSTLCDILMGLLKPTDGVMSVDGIPIETSMQRLSWGEHIAHVPQESFLLDGTVKENIAFGVEPGAVKREKIEIALKESGAIKFVENLPHGVNTRVGEAGLLLSGGQRQRLAIARAIYRDRDFLIFDEASSSLDDNSQESIIKMISELPKSITIVWVSHRVNSVEFCDRIYEVKSKTIQRG